MARVYTEAPSTMITAVTPSCSLDWTRLRFPEIVIGPATSLIQRRIGQCSTPLGAPLGCIRSSLIAVQGGSPLNQCQRAFAASQKLVGLHGPGSRGNWMNSGGSYLPSASVVRL